MPFSARGLMVTSAAVGAIAVATLALSVATDAWLFTKETMEKIQGNETVIKVVEVHMGLWKVCGVHGNDQHCCLNNKFNRC